MTEQAQVIEAIFRNLSRFQEAIEYDDPLTDEAEEAIEAMVALADEQEPQ